MIIVIFIFIHMYFVSLKYRRDGIYRSAIIITVLYLHIISGTIILLPVVRDYDRLIFPTRLIPYP